LFKTKERPAEHQLLKCPKKLSGFLFLSKFSSTTLRAQETQKRHLALQRTQIKCNKVQSLADLARQSHLMEKLSVEELLLIYSKKREWAVSIGFKLICQKFNQIQEKKYCLKL